jgi:heme A synthase
MSLYTIVLVAHSWLRWVALLAGVGATLTAFADRSGRHADPWGLALTAVLDLQMLIGLLLYLVLSPFTAEAFRDFSAAMKNPGLRFFAVEHIAMMFAAVVLAHLGRVLARKAPTPGAKRTRLIICFGLATILMIGGIPWPGMASGRPLFRV